MKHRCPCVGEILTLVTKVHDSPTSLNMGIPILLCQEHGKPPTFFQKNPNGRRASGKERHWLSNEYRYKHASIYIYIHIKLRSNLGKLRFSYFLWLEAGKATICTPIQVHCVTFCPLMQARCTLFFYLKYLAISELLQWSRLLSALNIITACILYRKQRSVVCILTNLHERRKMHMRLAFFFWNHICLLYIYVYINMNVFICM